MKTTPILDKIGNTPLVFLEEINGCPIYGKVEGQNPAGSIKDRVAFYMIADALEKGVLKEGMTIIEPTSGNTGIGLAFVGRELGFSTILVMPDNMSKERIAFMENYGGKVVLTPASLGMQGAVDKAKELAGELGGFIPDQFNNVASIKAHFETTAVEIFSALPQTRYVVAGVGTGGTAMGIAKYFRENNLSGGVFGIEPNDSKILRGGSFAPHKIQGIGANFLPSIVDIHNLLGIIPITDEDAFFGKTQLFERFSLYCGISSGAALIGARRLAESLKDKEKGAIVAILPDSGNRY